ncbi:uncharacterized protein LOC118185570 [Stegodyphus dumicola]|uniref:uncharacterized protein LOC118185570 n=1 Tax=Stegodyphus dumicola TaxID=202533 RepID=UPI0015A862AF|nr:uncharacterized protein LOC118185570 [Stegodyphus dumicola]
MWLLLFSPLLVLCSGNNEFDICKTDPNKACLSGLRELDFPETEKDLEKICPLIEDYIKCLGRYDEMCSTKLFSLPGQYGNILSLVDDICNKDSQFHKAIVEGLPCIGHGIINRNATCFNSQEELLNSYFEHLHSEDREVDSKEEHTKHMCLRFLHEVSCVGEYISKGCTTSGRDAFLDGMRRIGLPFERCSHDIIRDLSSTAEKLDLEETAKVPLRITFAKMLQND